MRQVVTVDHVRESTTLEALVYVVDNDMIGREDRLVREFPVLAERDDECVISKPRFFQHWSL
ncbi:hypothetical protein [Haladaptatus sp. DFWS20]|uniref:hypothetical protein n=1 Tax=Haladaptatus sp. DFWS20 TaxID=3403467 RepID=UPI003EB8F068